MLLPKGRSVLASRPLVDIDEIEVALTNNQLHDVVQMVFSIANQLLRGLWHDNAISLVIITQIVPSDLVRSLFLPDLSTGGI